MSNITLVSVEHFLAKHAKELGVIASVLSDIVSMLPIGRQERATITENIAVISNAAESIAASVAPDETAATSTVAEGQTNAFVQPGQSA